MAEASLPVSPTKRRALSVSLRVKLLIAFSLLFGVIFAGAFYWFYTFATSRAIDRVLEDLSVLADGTLQGINGDNLETVVQEAEPNEAGLSDHPAYQELIQWLGVIKEIDPRAGPTVMIQGDEPLQYRIVATSGAALDPENAVPFMDTFSLDEPNPEFDALFAGTAPDDRWYFGPYEDQYGRWISGYRTIRNADNEPIGVLGLDFEAAYYYSVRESVQNAAVPAFGITYVVVFVAVFIISDVFTRRIRILTRMADKVSEGDYEQDFDVLTQNTLHDEINTLADVFELMVSKVRQREEKLKQQVAELQIILDTGKRDEQVSEIVESDFFRDLRHKATDMRNRRTHTPQGVLEEMAAEEELAAASSQSSAETPATDTAQDKTQ